MCKLVTNRASYNFDVSLHFPLFPYSVSLPRFFFSPKDPVASTPYRIGCRLLAETISRHITDKNAQLLDIGAGSGYLAAEVSTHNVRLFLFICLFVFQLLYKIIFLFLFCVFLFVFVLVVVFVFFFCFLFMCLLTIFAEVMPALHQGFQSFLDL